jgi:hypothetical protein
MRLQGRLARAQADLGEALIWDEVRRLATEVAASPEEILPQVRTLKLRYRHYEIPMKRGKPDMEPFLRAVAQHESLDYDELAAEVKRVLGRFHVAGLPKPNVFA